jgi:hypothetical protein
MRLLNITIIAAAITASLSPAFASETFRQHEAHEHGHVVFNIAQDNNDLLIEITAPGMDVFGFEHPPQTPDEQQRVDQALELLQQSSVMIALNPQANCKIEQVDVTQTGDAEHMNEHNHAHEAHANNDTQPNHEHEHEHGSVNIQYQFTCQDMMQLTDLSTDWFKHFTHTTEIDASLLMDKKQFATELTAENPHINF